MDSVEIPAPLRLPNGRSTSNDLNQHSSGGRILRKSEVWLLLEHPS